jgi:hypothetical protein
MAAFRATESQWDGRDIDWHAFVITSFVACVIIFARFSF